MVPFQSISDWELMQTHFMFVVSISEMLFGLFVCSRVDLGKFCKTRARSECKHLAKVWMSCLLTIEQPVSEVQNEPHGNTG